MSLSIIASIWPIPTIICCVIHWISMTVWILVDSQGIIEFCRNYNHTPHMRPICMERVYSVLFASVIGIIHIFIYFNAIDGSTLWRHTFFYLICFIENITSNLLWLYTSPFEVKNAWYFNVLFAASISFFLLGIKSMIIYYNMFHPSKRYISTT